MEFRGSCSRIRLSSRAAQTLGDDERHLAGCQPVPQRQPRQSPSQKRENISKGGASNTQAASHSSKTIARIVCKEVQG